MSGVRKTFCAIVVSGAGGFSRPRKYGICGCIPAVIRSVERSSARGTRDADGRRRWPFSSKNERNPSRISALVRIRAILGSRSALYARRVSRPRKRYRYRPWRLTPVVAVMLVAALAGAWIGARRPTATLTQAAGPEIAIASPARHTIAAKITAPERLLTADSLLPHSFSPGLVAKAAILVDATTG